MTFLSGSCLCGSLSFEGDCDVKLIANCHCDDCRRATGAAYGTLLFADEESVLVQGESVEYEHVSDRGSKMTKIFCPTCGSQVFGRNSSRAGLLAIRAGAVTQKSEVVPTVNVYCESAIPTTPMDSTIASFDQMPG